MNSYATCLLLLFTQLDLCRFKPRKPSLYDVLYLLRQRHLTQTFYLLASFLTLHPFTSRYLLIRVVNSVVMMDLSRMVFEIPPLKLYPLHFPYAVLCSKVIPQRALPSAFSSPTFCSMVAYNHHHSSVGLSALVLFA